MRILVGTWILPGGTRLGSVQRGVGKACLHCGPLRSDIEPAPDVRRESSPPILIASVLAIVPPALLAEDTVVPAEQVRYDYAQVLRVEPVEQVVTVSGNERRCNDNGQCRQVRVPRELRRTIGYDVDYTWRGTKYRSRLAQDPGRRLRIRVGVTPVIGTQVKP